MLEYHFNKASSYNLQHCRLLKKRLQHRYSLSLHQFRVKKWETVGQPRQARQSSLSGGIRIRIPQELDAVAFWFWNLNVVFFWSWNLDVVVYVPPRPRFRYHRENKKITHNYVNYVVEKYFSCPNLCNIYLHNVCISKLE